MRASEILRGKGSDVVTVTPETPVSALLHVLAEHRIGAVVVSPDGKAVNGIVSERDVVRALSDRGGDVLSEAVTAICTHEVRTVAPDTQVDDVMRLMTEERCRHVPVVSDGDLAGIVSIGDVVKSRMDELESERAALAGYISSTG